MYIPPPEHPDLNLIRERHREKLPSATPRADGRAGVCMD